MNEFTHFNNNGEAIMVDVGDKKDTVREATASGFIQMSPECYEKIKNGGVKKGDVVGVARVAAIMGAKKTAELIPLCHTLSLNKVELKFRYHDDDNGIEAVCTVKTYGKTGVEMEALTGVNVALLTIYDMCKAIDKTMIFTNIMLKSKTGGKQDVYRREN